MFALLERIVLSECHFNRALPCWKIREPNRADVIKRLFGMHCWHDCRETRFVALLCVSGRGFLPECNINDTLPRRKVRESVRCGGFE